MGGRHGVLFGTVGHLKLLPVNRAAAVAGCTGAAEQGSGGRRARAEAVPKLGTAGSRAEGFDGNKLGAEWCMYMYQWV